MATPAIPAPPSPESAPQVSPQTPAPVAPAAPVSVQTSDRAAIYQQYYGSQEPPAPAPAAPVAPEPPPVAAPAPPPTFSEPAPDIAAQVATLVEQKLAEALQKFAPTPAPPVPPAEPPNDDWVSLLAQGKREEAEKILGRKLTAESEQRATTQALEMFRVEQDISNYLTDLRGKNPDLAPLEELVSVRAQRTLEAVQAAGKIKSNADFVSQYKAAVNSAVDDARKLVQQIRAAGNTAAMTLKTEVLSAQTLPPNAIEQNRGPAPPVVAQPQSLEEYMAARKALGLRGRGLAT